MAECVRSLEGGGIPKGHGAKRTGAADPEVSCTKDAVLSRRSV